MLVHLISGNYNEAKYCWLLCCEERINVVNEEIIAEGSDKVLSFILFKQCFERRYFFTCNSPHCPTKKLNNRPANFTFNMFFNLPETKEEISNQMIIESAMSIEKTGHRLFSNMNKFKINQNKQYFCNKSSAHHSAKSVHIRIVSDLHFAASG